MTGVKLLYARHSTLEHLLQNAGVLGREYKWIGGNPGSTKANKHREIPSELRRHRHRRSIETDLRILYEICQEHDIACSLNKGLEIRHLVNKIFVEKVEEICDSQFARLGIKHPHSVFFKIIGQLKVGNGCEKQGDSGERRQIQPDVDIGTCLKALQQQNNISKYTSELQVNRHLARHPAAVGPASCRQPSGHFRHKTAGRHHLAGVSGIRQRAGIIWQDGPASSGRSFRHKTAGRHHLAGVSGIRQRAGIIWPEYGDLSLLEWAAAVKGRRVLGAISHTCKIHLYGIRSARPTRRGKIFDHRNYLNVALYRSVWRSARVVVSHLGVLGSITCGVAPGFSHPGIVPDDATSRRVFSGISRSPHLYIPTLLHFHHNLLSPALKTSLKGARISPLH
ncbi:hypothetical protein PR048_016394 [Dryococelus australis]|uniref:Uncharacterized protein n=1 Tax=Dryococelus australis TaxID=614101 RepID=A0ABQ9HJM8_9NEOP|nr:hypothetical protein PR048_016394 [Dryococelus australis]